MNYHITPKSANVKTGPIPVTTTSAKTCPPACPFNTTNTGGCYANGGPLALHWKKVTDGERGGSIQDLSRAIDGLPDGQLWRHNQAGDLPGCGNRINGAELSLLVRANKGKRGFTYTHKPVLGDSLTAARNRGYVAEANNQGMTINLSGNNLEHADELAALDIGPVVAVVPRDYPEKGQTKAGRRVIVCPAQTRENVSCATCKMCARPGRDFIVGFRAHGSQAKKAEESCK